MKKQQEKILTTQEFIEKLDAMHKELGLPPMKWDNSQSGKETISFTVTKSPKHKDSFQVSNNMQLVTMGCGIQRQ